MAYLEPLKILGEMRSGKSNISVFLQPTFRSLLSHQCTTNFTCGTLYTGNLKIIIPIYNNCEINILKYVNNLINKHMNEHKHIHPTHVNFVLEGDNSLINLQNQQLWGMFNRRFYEYKTINWCKRRQSYKCQQVLKFHPYKIQKLYEDNFDRRFQFCEIVTERVKHNFNFIFLLFVFRINVLFS